MIENQPPILVPNDVTEATSVTKPLLQGPKRQHFLPRFYLEGFAKDGFVAVFDRESNEIRVQQPVNTGVIGHFYTMEDEQGRRRFEIEQLLSEYEGKAKPVIDKLSAKEDISADERSDLAIFIALAVTRTPDGVDSVKAFNGDMVKWAAKHLFSNVEEVKGRLRTESDGSASDEQLDAEARLMVQLAQEGGLTVTTDHRWAVGMAIQMALEIAPIFVGRNWVVIHRDNEKKSFVTSDAPVCLTTVAPRENNFWGVGFGNSDALVLFALNESCMLAMFGQDGDLQHTKADTKQVRQMNIRTADHCQRFVIGRETALVRSLADHLRLAAKRWRPKMQAQR